MSNYEKKGYLHSDFKLFYLTDNSSEEPDYHYHDFDKIIIFIKGHISYMIEGRSYDLQPHDIVLVNRNHIHKPFIDNSIPYERIIIYISRNFIDTYRTDSYDLSYCFQKAKQEASYVLRFPNTKNNVLLESTVKLERSFRDGDYAHELKQQLDVLEFMIYLNRAARKQNLDFVSTSSHNQKIIETIDYINTHLAEDISIESIARHFYISKYYMMRTFKEVTGYTILDYITMKRMILAKKLIEDNKPLTDVALECGYNGYSTFYRCFKKFYGYSPKMSH
ncbi:MAG: AraC family transcriptional regulator [Eubacteriales bacterium]